jgi:hypothetical protein
VIPFILIGLVCFCLGAAVGFALAVVFLGETIKPSW